MSDPAAAPRRTSRVMRRSRDNLSWLLVLLTIVAVGAVRVRLLDVPLERDEGEYAYAGQLLLQGILPYQQTYNMKLPGTYFMYALMMWLFGETSKGIHLGLLVINALTIVLVFLLSRQLFDRWAGVAASASYAVLSVGPSVLGPFAHAEHFVVFFALSGTVLLVKILDSDLRGGLFFSGVLFGLSFLMKQQGVFFPIFGVLLLAWNRSQARPIRMGALFRDEAVLCAGVVLPVALTAGVLAAAGVFERFWFWTVRYAQEYIAQVHWSLAPTLFAERFSAVVRPAVLLWGTAGLGVIALLADRRWRSRRAGVIGFLAASWAAVCPGWYFRNHYFVLVLPATALLIGVAVSSAGALPWRAIGRGVALTWWGVSLGTFVFEQRDVLFELPPREVSRAVYGFNPFQESVDIADYLQRHTAPGSRVAVLGSEPQIYFYAKRLSATGYIYMYGLMENQRYASTMQGEMIAEIERADPDYVVWVNVPLSWLARPDSELHLFEWVHRYLQAKFKRVGVADMIPPGPTRYVWDREAADYVPRSPAFISIYEKKAR